MKHKMNAITANRYYNELRPELYGDNEFQTAENVRRFDLVLQDTWGKSGKTDGQDLPFDFEIAM